MGICSSKPSFGTPPSDPDVLFGGMPAEEGYVDYVFVPSQSVAKMMISHQDIGIFRIGNSNYSSSVPIDVENPEYMLRGAGISGFKLQYGDPIKHKSHGNIIDLKYVPRGQVQVGKLEYVTTDKRCIKSKVSGGVDTNITLVKKAKSGGKTNIGGWTMVEMNDGYTAEYTPAFVQDEEKEKAIMELKNTIFELSRKAEEETDAEAKAKLKSTITDLSRKTEQARVEADAIARERLKSTVLNLSRSGRSVPLARLYEGAADSARIGMRKALEGKGEMALFRAEYFCPIGLRLRDSLQDDEKAIAIALIAALSKELTVPITERSTNLGVGGPGGGPGGSSGRPRMSIVDNGYHNGDSGGWGGGGDGGGGGGWGGGGDGGGGSGDGGD